VLDVATYREDYLPRNSSDGPKDKKDKGGIWRIQPCIDLRSENKKITKSSCPGWCIGQFLNDVDAVFDEAEPLKLKVYTSPHIFQGSKYHVTKFRQFCGIKTILARRIFS
jgi:hypothetical protein